MLYKYVYICSLFNFRVSDFFSVSLFDVCVAFKSNLPYGTYYGIASHENVVWLAMCRRFTSYYTRLYVTHFSHFALYNCFCSFKRTQYLIKCATFSLTIRNVHRYEGNKTESPSRRTNICEIFLIRCFCTKAKIQSKIYI